MPFVLFKLMSEVEAEVEDDPEADPQAESNAKKRSPLTLRARRTIAGSSTNQRMRKMIKQTQKTTTTTRMGRVIIALRS